MKRHHWQDLLFYSDKIIDLGIGFNVKGRDLSFFETSSSPLRQREQKC